jgi:hypothetical protein
LIRATERMGREVSAARTSIDYFFSGIPRSTSVIPIFSAVSRERSSR